MNNTASAARTQVGDHIPVPTKRQELVACAIFCLAWVWIIATAAYGVFMERW